jgi:RND family efflux transporter MFP subunit
MLTVTVRRWSCLLIGFGGLAIAGCGHQAQTDAAKEAPRVTVAHPTVRSLVDEDDYTGWLVASQTVEVRARVRGHIQKVCFKDGDLVQKGQLLFELDPRPFQAAVDQALAQAKALEAQKIAAEKNAARVEELIKAKAVATSEYEQVVADAQSYVARIAAEMQVVARLKLDLEFSRVTAPIAGRIGRALLTEGNLVNAGGSDPLLATIVAVDPIYVDFNVDERAMQRYQDLAMGRRDKAKPRPLREQALPFSFGLDTEKGFPHEGQIIFADNKYSEGTGTILVRGTVHNADGRLIPGSRVRVRIPVSDKYQAVLVPDTAVLSDLDRKYLLVLGQDNMVLRRDISPGRLLDDGMRVILPAPGEKPGAKSGERSQDWQKDWEKTWVITVGLQRARINYPVQPLDAGGQPINTAAAAK